MSPNFGLRHPRNGRFSAMAAQPPPDQHGAHQAASIRKRPHQWPPTGPRSQEELRLEENDPNLIVMRIKRSAQNPNGELLHLHCPPAVFLEQARQIMRTAAPSVRLPDPASYAGLSEAELQRAYREEWRTIFDFYVRNNYLPMMAPHLAAAPTPVQPVAINPVPSEDSAISSSSSLASSSLSITDVPSSSSSDSDSSPPPSVACNIATQSTPSPPSFVPGTTANYFRRSATAPMTATPPVQQQENAPLTLASSALLTSHRRSALVVPPNLSVDFRSDAGSLLFLKRFRLNSSHSTPRSPRPQLEKDAEYGDFVIMGQGHAKRKGTGEIFQCTVLIDDEYEKLLKLHQRLDEAYKYYREDDLEELKSMILDPRNVCLKTGTEQYTYFTPQHCGSLHSTAQKAGVYGEEKSQKVFNTLVRLTAFAHTLGIILRDLTLRKFVFTDAAKTRLQLAIFTDVIVLDSPSSPDEQIDKFGCPAYVSPEILTCGDNPFAGKSADIWSLGVLLFVLLTGRYPFYDTTPRGLFQKIKKAKVEIPSIFKLSPNVRALIFGLLRRFPQERPTAELLKHLPWVNGRDNLSGAVARPRGPVIVTVSDDDDEEIPEEIHDFLAAEMRRTSLCSSHA